MMTRYRTWFSFCTLALFLTPFFQGSAVSQEVNQGQEEGEPYQSTQDWNRRLQELGKGTKSVNDSTRGRNVPLTGGFIGDYRIGAEDLLEIYVFEAPELNRTVRVAGKGDISLPLLGSVKAAGLVPHELESVLQELLRRSYLKDPHVGVYVKEMQSHPVSVFGAVRKPGIMQIRQAKSLIEILSMAEGLAEDAGNSVIVMRRASFEWHTSTQGFQMTHEVPPQNGGGEVALSSENIRIGQKESAVEISLKDLLESGDPSLNILVYPGDVVKVARAGIVYVVGDVKRPGGYVLKSNENISVLQAIAMAEGLEKTAAKSKALIIRTDEETGERIEIPLDLQDVLTGSAPDIRLFPNDILFVPNSGMRTALIRAGETALSIVTGVLIWRR